MTVMRSAGAASLFSVDTSDVSITAVKKAEADGATILRLFQTTGTPLEIDLFSYYPVRHAEEVNGIELSVESRRVSLVDAHTVKIAILAYEPVTIRLEF